MDINNPVIKLCIKGARAEFEGRIKDARSLYLQAWETSRDDYEACVAAHYMARRQDDPARALHWNQAALDHAEAVGDERVHSFYPSLYVNLGHSHAVLGNSVEAEYYYKLAAGLGHVHSTD